MSSSQTRNYEITVLERDGGYAWKLETLDGQMIAMSHGIAIPGAKEAFALAKMWVIAHEQMGYEVRPNWWEPKEEQTPQSIMEADNKACLRKKLPEEPMFIILGRDPDGGNIVRLWGERRIKAGDRDHGMKALSVAKMMDEWAKDHKPHSGPDKRDYGPIGNLSELVAEDVVVQRVFTKGLTLRGNLHSSYCFESEDEKSAWKMHVLPKLHAKYEDLELREFDLPGLKVGENCLVAGEGSEIFKIVGIVKYSDNRYGFCMESGDTEEIVKCRRAGD
jgi:hypothetical protein